MFVGNSILPHLRRLSRAEHGDGIHAALGFPRFARLRRRDPNRDPVSTNIWLLTEPHISWRGFERTGDLVCVTD